MTISAYELVEALETIRDMRVAIEGIQIVENAVDTFVDDPEPTNEKAIIVGAGLVVAWNNLDYLKSVVGFLPDVIVMEIKLKQKSARYIAKVILS